MNTNHKGYAAGWKPFLGLLLAVCFLATAVHADSLFTGTFRLTNEVRWGNAVLTPGDYSIALDQSTHTLVVRNADTGKNVVRAIAAGAYYKVGNDDSELLIVHLGNQRAVSAVRLAGLGEVFQQAHPFPASKRAVEEAHNTEAIPVELAKK
jgi:hypothetical protein